MPSAFETRFLAQGWPALAAQLGVPVTFTPAATGTPATITVLMGDQERGRDQGDRREVERATLECTAQISDVGTPEERQDTIAYDGVTYVITRTRERVNGTVRLELERQETKRRNRRENVMGG